MIDNFYLFSFAVSSGFSFPIAFFKYYESGMRSFLKDVFQFFKFIFRNIFCRNYRRFWCWYKNKFKKLDIHRGNINNCLKTSIDESFNRSEQNIAEEGKLSLSTDGYNKKYETPNFIHLTEIINYYSYRHFLKRDENKNYYFNKLFQLEISFQPSIYGYPFELFLSSTKEDMLSQLPNLIEEFECKIRRIIKEKGSGCFPFDSRQRKAIYLSPEIDERIVKRFSKNFKKEIIILYKKAGIINA